MKLTGGRGFDVILEMLANKNLAKDLVMLNKFGRVVVVGSRGTVEIDPRNLMGRDGAILGMTSFNIPDQDLAGIHAALVAGLENGNAAAGGGPGDSAEGRGARPPGGDGSGRIRKNCAYSLISCAEGFRHVLQRLRQSHSRRRAPVRVLRQTGGGRGAGGTPARPAARRDA